MYSEEAYEAFSKKMHETYPAMFSQPYGGFAIGAGWWPIIESLCANIQSHINHNNQTHERLLADNPYGHEVPAEIPQVVVHQIKEKFGGLRFYYEGGDEQVFGMVRMAEAWASKTCEKCGDKGELRGGGWVRTLCDAHEAEYQARKKEDRE